MQGNLNRRRLLGLSALIPVASLGLAGTAGASPAAAVPAPAGVPVPLLPQYDGAPWLRQGAIAQAKSAYTWTEDLPFVPGIPAAYFVPLDSIPTIEWLLDGVDTVLTMALNLIGSLIPQFNAGATGTLPDSEKQLLAIRQQSKDARVRFTALGGGKYNELGDRPSDAYVSATPEESAQATVLQSEVMGLFQQVQIIVGNLRDNIQALLESNQGIGNFGTKDGLAQYNAIWQTAPIPDVAENLHDDELFAFLRVGGFNTNVIERVDGALPENFPLTDQQYREGLGAQDSLETAIRQGRLFIVDYAELGKMAPEHATYKILTGEGYNSAPIAVFAIAPGRDKLAPVAIQCGQNPATAPMFVRPKPDDQEHYWGWQMAKTVVQTADFNHHEMLAHLSRAHLVSEVFALATNRAFAPNHPLSVLLKPHFEGDIFINFLAATIIMPPNLFADVILAAPLPDILETVGKDRLNWDFYERMPHRDFARRGLDDASVLREFPYRDDALLVWEAISAWMDDYVRVYYTSDADVVADSELAAWVVEVTVMGKMKGFREITSVEQLIEVLTMVVYTASAYHASVNYPQSHLMAYAPFVAGMTSTPAPTTTAGFTEADWIKSLPGLLTSIAQFYFLNVLGTIYYRPLGDYRTNIFPFPPSFGDPRIADIDGPLQHFRRDLAVVEAEINRRNQSRSQPYEYLLPSNIPTSTNI
ncbi:arachidonate 15-lipoxygenase (plasmid) [Rhodococcus qingshengii]|uniref:lipoxygenase family protein n=1 Tax=Rhodococcus qingshengii TaxID=334542 RepID=UPI0007E5647C|nr:lipoxygenase family protein [Rhodococcus qingshengii]BCF86581.1 arachidonate 15-lipoxygenase [Rhodococcus qingshengii]